MGPFRRHPVAVAAVNRPSAGGNLPYFYRPKSKATITIVTTERFVWQRLGLYSLAVRHAGKLIRRARWLLVAPVLPLIEEYFENFPEFFFPLSLSPPLYFGSADIL